MDDIQYDAIVVGSGISGGWAAKELCEKGLKTLLLERGRNVAHVTDYVNAIKNPWEIPHRSMTPLVLSKEYPTVRMARLLYEANSDWWANEKDCPYVEAKPFDCCTKTLRYVETPGAYRGDVPYKKGDRAWFNPSRRIN